MENFCEIDFDFSFDERTNYFTGYDETKEVYMDQKFKLDKSKNENIAKFLFTKAPVPRSYRMIGNLFHIFLLNEQIDLI